MPLLPQDVVKVVVEADSAEEAHRAAREKEREDLCLGELHGLVAGARVKAQAFRPPVLLFEDR